MLKRIAALGGCIALGSGTILSVLLVRHYVKAQHEDEILSTGSVVSGGLGCTSYEPHGPTFESSLSKRVLSESESLIVTVHLQRQATEECKLEVFMDAPAFDVSPGEKIEVTFEANQKQKDVLWVLVPKKMGTWDVATTVRGGPSKNKGVVVTNVLGLTVFQAQVLSYLSYFLGPGLTLPWWYDKWKARKRPSKKKSKRKR